MLRLILTFIAFGVIGFTIGLMAIFKVRFAQTIIRYGVPVLLLFQLLFLVLSQRNPVLTSASNFFIILLTGLLPAVGAAICAFRPRRISFALCAAAGLTGVLSPSWLTLSSATFLFLCSVTAFLFSCFGIFMPSLKVKTKEQPVQQPEIETATETGRLMLLMGEYAGESLPVDETEELRLGSDAAFCNIVLPTDMPPRLCGIRWTGQRNTYLVTSYSSRWFADENGRPMPENSSAEFRAGTAFYLVSSGEAVFQIG